ncbi:MAG: hypothetical protein N5P05_004293 (plasmid) [Chroococcopsis gigantea SAG 12.99]|jgi:hypothetical protein|nr:hypothetical protein [Chroococcopsis gigantea SAG 12.99]
MADDVRSLLTSRNRPKVNRRETSLKLNRGEQESPISEVSSLISENLESSTDQSHSTFSVILDSPENLPILKEGGEDVANSNEAEFLDDITDEYDFTSVTNNNKLQQSLELDQIQQLQAELDNLPQIGKRLAIHLEQEIRANLLQLCDRQEITPETFIEAAYALFQENPDLVEPIVKDAKKRLKQRKRAGLIRRTLSMMDACRR